MAKRRVATAIASVVLGSHVDRSCTGRGQGAAARPEDRLDRMLEVDDAKCTR